MLPKISRESTTRYLLKGSRCTSCGRTFFPERSFCPGCGRKGRLEPAPLDAPGKILSASILRLKRPETIAVVEVNGCRIPTRITDLEADDVMGLIGLEVEPTFRRVRTSEVIEYGLIFKPMDGWSIKARETKRERRISGKAGIVGYGSYIPKFRVKVEELCRAFGRDPDVYKKGLGIEEKSVGNLDEDTITFSVEAAKRALGLADVNPDDVGFVALGTESPPYAVKSAVTTISMAIGTSHGVRGRTSEFACKAATDQIPDALNAVNSNETRYSMVIGADRAQAEPGDELYFSVGEGGCALLFGKSNVIASIEGYTTYMSDTPDFWRMEGEEYPKHGGRFTGEPGYFRHVVNAARNLMDDLGLRTSDFDYAVFHSPNSKFPIQAAKKLGLEMDKIKQGLVVRWIGNTYAACTLIGLASILDVAKSNERILAVSYGSGAGSDAMSIMTEDAIEEVGGITVEEQIRNKSYVDHDFYAISKGVLK
ncbi:MAG: hydroxymethylglutaryl-CoA synthase [Candidatus Bathyarchaeia archaeon]